MLEVDSQTEQRLCDSSQLVLKPPGGNYCLCKLHRGKTSFMMTLMKLSWQLTVLNASLCHSAPVLLLLTVVFFHDMLLFCWNLSRNTALSSQLLPSFPESSPSVSCSLRSRVWLSLCSCHRRASHSTSVGRLWELHSCELDPGTRTKRWECVCLKGGRGAENRMPIGKLATHPAD